MQSLFQKLKGKLFPHIEKASYDSEDMLMTTYWSDGKMVLYSGSFYSWKELPTKQHCNLSRCETLEAIFHYINDHGNPYPNAHTLNS
ncbi:MAG: hypothetical protein AAF363_15600 [Bacteroidota bacterium]